VDDDAELRNSQVAAGFNAFAALHSASKDVDFDALVVLVDDLNSSLTDAAWKVGRRTLDILARVERWDTNPHDQLSAALVALDSAGVSRNAVVEFVAKWSV